MRAGSGTLRLMLSMYELNELNAQLKKTISSNVSPPVATMLNHKSKSRRRDSARANLVAAQEEEEVDAAPNGGAGLPGAQRLEVKLDDGRVEVQADAEAALDAIAGAGPSPRSAAGEHPSSITREGYCARDDDAISGLKEGERSRCPRQSERG